MSDLTVNELLSVLVEVGSEGKHTFVADSTGRVLMLEPDKTPQHINLEQLTFWCREGRNHEIKTGL